MSWSDGLDPELAAAGDQLLEYATQSGYGPTVTSTVRSFWKQSYLWNRWRAGLAQYPAAPPGYSAHEQGWAFDLAVTPDEAYDDLGAVWEWMGGTWGGRFHDRIHFELPGASAYLAELAKTRGAVTQDSMASALYGLIP